MVEIRVQGVPRDNDTHTWSDFLELLTLVNLDSVCSLEFALDRMTDAPHEDSDVEDDDGAETLSLSESRLARRRERYSVKLADAFALCSWRQNAYGEKYPFRIDASVPELLLKPELTESHYSYLFLLMCGNLPFVTRARNSLTDNFELFCKDVFKNVLPSGCEVHVFGKAASARYVGSKFEKFSLLCSDVKGHLKADENYFRRGDQGDGGIDLVAWKELGDLESNIPVSFGQCACSREEWVKKQAEVMPEYLATTMSCTPSWMPFVFLPICFRESSGGWAVKGEVKSVVLMDRFRLMSSCSDHLSTNNAINARAIVAEVSASEAIV